MEPTTVTMEEVYFFGQLLFYLKAHNPEGLQLMLDSGLEQVSDTLTQIANGDR